MKETDYCLYYSTILEITRRDWENNGKSQL